MRGETHDQGACTHCREPDQQRRPCTRERRQPERRAGIETGGNELEKEYVQMRPVSFRGGVQTAQLEVVLELASRVWLSVIFRV